MSSTMTWSRRKTFLYGILTLFIIGLAIVIYTDQSIRKQIEEKRFLAPAQYYSSPKKFFLGQIFSVNDFKAHFEANHYRQRPFGSHLSQGDYAIGNSSECNQVIELQEGLQNCVSYHAIANDQLYLVALNEWDQISAVFNGEPLRSSLFAQGEPQLFAQYLGKEPTLQYSAELGEIPRYCLDAVLAIEDPQFLEHRGISVRGLLRAVAANLLHGWGSQGGSTITQQLVKNYFLTPEKKISRKIKEILISLIFELRVSKDDILQTYLNIIYLGQSGVFEVRGYKAAAEHYFQKPLEDLNLADCALLAAIVNSPGRYNPVRHPERAKQRRERVLEKMKEHQMVSESEFEGANQSPLPKHLKRHLSASAPYFVDAVNKTLVEKGFEDLAGLKVYTSMDPQAQIWAENAVQAGIDNFERGYPAVKKLKEENKLLQAVLISSNPLTGEITALVGGRDFRSSPYNRAIEAHRQVGSIMKPIVYLTALGSLTETGEPYTPLTLLNNSPFRYEYEGQVWEPKNYDGTFSGPVPLFYALKESLNVPTARLATQVGLEKVIETARHLGVQSKLKAFPSLALGAFELKPIEVLQVYNTISQLGVRRPLKLIHSVVNYKDEVVYSEANLPEWTGDPEQFSVLVAMMKQTLISGTGQWAAKLGMTHVAAGKTGTTSDTKDAWFAGFTPFHVAVVWTGYDDGSSHKLTGASGALPIWADYMKRVSKASTNRDFPFAEDLEKKILQPEDFSQWGVPPEKAIRTELLMREPN
ncbi:MAG: transglycosylase domain-containing protein [Bdellovibrionales bacterium]|nr:transglycosylase domain-containing protein [Bdellovibrionales bacterium]